MHNGNQAVVQSIDAVRNALVSKKTFDANGWTVYDFGQFKKYCKMITFATGGTAGPVVAALSSSTLPVGITNIQTQGAFLQGSLDSNGNAYAVSWNFENSTTGINVTWRSSTGGALTQNCRLYVEITL